MPSPFSVHTWFSFSSNTSWWLDSQHIKLFFDEGCNVRHLAVSDHVKTKMILAARNKEKSKRPSNTFSLTGGEISMFPEKQIALKPVD